MSVVGGKIFKASIVVLICKVIWKFGGFLGKIALSLYGRGATTDAYLTASDAVLLNLFYAGDGIVKPAFLPVFTETLQKDGERKAWRFANSVLALVLTLALSLVVIVTAFAPGIVQLVAAKYSQETKDLTAFLLRMMFPALIVLSLGTVTYAILNSYKRFAFPEAGESTLKFLFCIVVFAGFPFFPQAAWLLGLGVLLGAIGRIVCHLIGLRDKLGTAGREFELASPAMKKFCLLAFPLVIGAVIAFLRFILENHLASPEEGLFTSLRLAKSVTDTFVSVVPLAAAIGMFPYLSELMSRGQKDEAADAINRTVRSIAVIVLPLTFFLVIMATPIVEVVYGRAKWSAEDIHETATVLQVYALGLFFYAIEQVMMNSFFAMRRTWFPMGMGVGASLFHMVFILAGVGLFPDQRLMVLALALPISRGVKNVTLAGVLRRHLPVFPARETGHFLLRLALAAAATGAAAWGVDHVLRSVPLGHVLHLPKVIVGLFRLGLATGAAGAVFLVTALFLRLEEIGTLKNYLRRESPHATK